MASFAEILSKLLAGASTLGVAAIAVERIALGMHLGDLRKRGPRVGISILKPLCGVDDSLAGSLEEWATINYAPYELLLGVKDTEDPAYPIATDLATRYPTIVSVYVQDGEPGLNPKVNQLITLETHAKYDILLISDSNTRPPVGYLDEMASMFADPTVGCATNPTSGIGHKTLGSMFDNMHLSTVGAAHVAAKVLANADFVTGASQAIRRATLDALGGFIAYKDYLAEDYVIGRDVGQKLGQHVAVGQLPIFNVSVDRTLKSFWDRNARWAVVTRTSTNNLLEYLAIGMLNPIPLAALAWALNPKPAAKRKQHFARVTAAKILLDVLNAQALQVKPLGPIEAMTVPVKDAVLFGTWVRGLFVRSVQWRGNTLNVTEGSQLVPADGTTAAQAITAQLPATAEECFFEGVDPPRAYFRSPLRGEQNPQRSGGSSRPGRTRVRR